jgi:hypothetical protein
MEESFKDVLDSLNKVIDLSKPESIQHIEKLKCLRNRCVELEKKYDQNKFWSKWTMYVHNILAKAFVRDDYKFHSNRKLQLFLLELANFTKYNTESRNKMFQNFRPDLSDTNLKLEEDKFIKWYGSERKIESPPTLGQLLSEVHNFQETSQLHTSAGYDPNYISLFGTNYSDPIGPIGFENNTPGEDFGQQNSF